MTRPPLSRDKAAIEAAAADWIVRRGESVRPALDDEEFYAWLESDPRHGDIYDSMAQTLEDIGQLTDLGNLPRAQRSNHVRYGVFALAAAACLALVAFGFFGITLLSGRPQSYETAIAETKTLTLADGSRVTMGASSKLSIELRQHDRRIKLQSGEAFFEVAHDKTRPFYVEAGGTMVRVLGTKFDVHRGVNGVAVSVQEGRVEIRDVRAVTISPVMRVLTAGQKTEIQERPTYIALAAPPPPLEISGDRAGSWRSGRLSYDNARLSDVVADINRYYAPGVKIENADANEMRVTAAFRANEIPAFLDALAETLPISVKRQKDGQYNLSPDETSN